MSVFFQKILNAYPDDPQVWSDLFFSRKTNVFYPFSLKSQKAERSLKSQDWCLKQSPSRFGIGVRPYTVGDPIRAVSRSLLLRTNKSYVQLDHDVGQYSVTLVWCDSLSLTYQGFDEKSQGTLALLVADYLKSYHLREGHHVRLILLNAGSSWLNQLSSIKSDLVCLIGDGLWEPSWVQSWRLFEALFQSKHHVKFELYQVRSKTFLKKNNPLAKEGWSLLPFGKGGRLGSYQSGPGYLKALEEEENYLTNELASFYNVDLFLVDQDSFEMSRKATSSFL
jgi:hypothetical protein